MPRVTEESDRATTGKKLLLRPELPKRHVEVIELISLGNTFEKTANTLAERWGEKVTKDNIKDMLVKVVYPRLGAKNAAHMVRRATELHYLDITLTPLDLQSANQLIEDIASIVWKALDQ